MTVSATPYRSAVVTLLFFCSFLFSLGAAAIPTPSSIVVFGDSLSDVGNRLAQDGVPVAPYVNGRVTNGDNYVDVLANNFGLSSQHSLGGGSNYAFSGAQIATGSESMTSQLSSYFADSGGAADPNALYIVFGGGNDLRAIAGGDPNVTLGNSVSGLAGIVSDLSAAGATNILVPNLPNLGLTPEAQDSGSAGAATAFTGLLNSQVAAALAGLSISANVILFDTFGFTNDAVANPGANGLSNVTDRCYDGATGAGGAGNVCANPDQYLFWDGLHPTSAAHQLLGDAIYAQVVPVPAALPLMMSALAMLGLIGRSRSARRSVAA